MTTFEFHRLNVPQLLKKYPYCWYFRLFMFYLFYLLLTISFDHSRIQNILNQVLGPKEGTFTSFAFFKFLAFLPLHKTRNYAVRKLSCIRKHSVESSWRPRLGLEAYHRYGNRGCVICREFRNNNQNNWTSLVFILTMCWQFFFKSQWKIYLPITANYFYHSVFDVSYHLKRERMISGILNPPVL